MKGVRIVIYSVDMVPNGAGNGCPWCRHGFPSLCVLCLFLTFTHECENSFIQCGYSYCVRIQFNMVWAWKNAVIFCVNLWNFYLSFHSS